MDVRNLIFPMTAGDLVQSAVVLAQVQRGDGPDLRALRVDNIVPEGDGHQARVWFSDAATFETFSVLLSAGTPLLITNISRS